MAHFVIGKRARQSDAGESSSDSPHASWKTLRSGTRRTITFGARLTITFALTAIMTVGILVFILSFVWEGQFQRYARSNMQQLANATASELALHYEEEGGWTNEVLSYASSATSTSADAGIQVLNADGTVIYDDTWVVPAQSSRGSGSEGSMPAEPVSRAPESSDAYVTASIRVNDEKVGTVRVWANGSDVLLTRSDAAFRSNSYGAIWTAAAIAVAFACILGVFVSRSLTDPLKRVTSTAKQIRNGELSARTGLSGEDEIGELGETFDEMATTLERDLKLEHRLTSDVAHELRTPLMAMMATVEAMQDGVLPTDDQHLGSVADETRRLSRLVDAMLQLSRMENGKTKFEPKRTDIVGLVRGLVTSQEQLFADRGLRLLFTSETPHRECYASVDRDMVRQAVVNFMSNALRYTPEGGWVVVNVAQGKGDVLISVSDTGIGIAKEDLPKVFSRFWRSDASRERASGGLGVGMALAKEIADRHHGYISVESELGKGTMFTLHLPREYKAEQSSSATIES